MEVATDGESTHVRDSRDRTGPVLTFSTAAFRDFIAAVRSASD
ncbi:DUF397 domain-containing protein [Dactylosporangium sp. NPDC051541]